MRRQPETHEQEAVLCIVWLAVPWETAKPARLRLWSGGWPSRLVVNATTRNLVVTGSIPNWATTSAKRTLRSRVQFPESPRPGNVWACAGRWSMVPARTGKKFSGTRVPTWSPIIVLPEPAHA